MKLIYSDYEILEQGVGMDGINEQIELAGRTCYKSEDKITKDSAKDFVDRMIKSGHGAMLEHGTVYLICPIEEDASIFNRYYKNKYSICKNYMFNGKDSTFITTNLRVLVDNGWLGDLKYLSEPIPNGHEKRITVKFTCDRGVSHEFVRHRVFSFAQESTRYCNYSKDKFGNELTFIIPSCIKINMTDGRYEWEDKNPLVTAGMDERDCGYDDSSNLWIEEANGNMTECKWARTEEYDTFFKLLQNSEDAYNTLIKENWKPQDARAILPNCLKTELVMTGFASDWKGFFKLRDNSKAHPDAQALAKPLHEEFIKKGYIDGNMD